MQRPAKTHGAQHAPHSECPQPTRASPPNPLLGLQRRVGNHAVATLVQRIKLGKLRTDTSPAFSDESHTDLQPSGVRASGRTGDVKEGAARRVMVHTGREVIARSFDNWKVNTEVEQARKARFDAFVDRAVTAGIDRDLAEGAGSVTLRQWGGWSHPLLLDFAHAWIVGPKGFKAQLGEQLKSKVQAGPLEALLDAIFADTADDAVLRALGKAAGFQPGDQRQQQQQRCGFLLAGRTASSTRAPRFSKPISRVTALSFERPGSTPLTRKSGRF